MAINDAATFAVGSVHYYTAPVGTPLPELGGTIAGPWTEIGHTSLEDILSTESEGGELTILGSIQNKNLRTRRSPRSETFKIILQQFDEAGLRLYYGANMELVEGGRALGVPSDPKPTSVAFLAVFEDADAEFVYYAPKSEIIRGDDMEFADSESLAGLPLAITPLNHNTNKWPFAVVPVVGLVGDDEGPSTGV